ncbi:MAG: hypothetical protein L3J95_01135 [Thermoplasmata archaeon]|nr:hypothetical protein [Thermoplasmata archaeon]MCI4359020.1 hypothetical protein [Thermoplasmata archaeon]
MLIERVFDIGGAVCVGLGISLAYGFVATGMAYDELVLSGGLSAGFGVLFLRVGRAARRHRRELLQVGQEGIGFGAGGPPKR